MRFESPEDETMAKNLLWLFEYPQDQFEESCPFFCFLSALPLN